jgi:hypothetical protein
MTALFCCVGTKSASGDGNPIQHMGGNEVAEEDAACATPARDRQQQPGESLLRYGQITDACLLI